MSIGMRPSSIVALRPCGTYTAPAIQLGTFRVRSNPRTSAVTPTMECQRDSPAKRTCLPRGLCPGQNLRAVAEGTIATAALLEQIGAGKRPSRFEADVHHPEVVGRDRVQPEERSRRRHDGPSSSSDRLATAPVSGSVFTSAAFWMPGCGLHPLLEGPIEGETAVGRPADGPGRRDDGGDDPLRREAGIDAGQHPQAAHEEAGRDHEQDGARDLRNRQADRIGQAMACRPSRPPPSIATRSLIRRA